MARTVRDQPEHDDSLLGSLVVPVVIVAVVALVGWALLSLAKGVVVSVAYAVGISMVVVTALLSPRLLRGRTGRARWRRIASLATVMVLGALLVVLAHEVSRHGWLLVAIPAAVVAVWALVERVTGR